MRRFTVGQALSRIGRLGLILLWLAATGCGASEKGDQTPALIVGSTQITAAELQQRMLVMTEALDLEDGPQEVLREMALEQIIDRFLVLEHGKETGVGLAEQEMETTVREIKRDYGEEGFREVLMRAYVDEQTWLRQLREHLLVNKIMGRVLESVPPPGNREIQEYFEAHRDEFDSPPRVKFRQVVSRSRKEAEQVLKRIRQGEEMGQIARSESIAPEADAEGLVGWVARGQLDPVLEEALFGLSPGQTSPVIETPYGYHVLEVLEASAPVPRTLPEALAEIEARLTFQKQAEFSKGWLKDLRSRYRIQVDRKLLAAKGLS